MFKLDVRGNLLAVVQPPRASTSVPKPGAMFRRIANDNALNRHAQPTTRFTVGPFTSNHGTAL